MTATTWQALREHILGKRRTLRSDEPEWLGLLVGEVYVVVKAGDVRGRPHLVIAAGVVESAALQAQKALFLNAGLERGALAVEEGACLLREVRPLDELTVAAVDQAFDHLAAEAWRIRGDIAADGRKPACFDEYRD